MKKSLKVIELFAGVGGFRIGLEQASGKNGSFEVVWSNQWEPGSKKQHASEVYAKRFGRENHSNEDIAKVLTTKIPNHDLLVGGFPCQDYSVARTLSQAAGLKGKKGVLWWQIHRILSEKKNHKPDYLFLENVDRLLKSPAKNRGRDFAIMLASLADLGYAVEWRVINAADYGFPQRRRRVFIVGYKKGSNIYKKFVATNLQEWLLSVGTIADAFPTKDASGPLHFEITGTPETITKNYKSASGEQSPFLNCGAMINRKITTYSVKPDYRGKQAVLSDILLDEKDVPEEFFIKKSELPAWKYLKGAKAEERKSSNGHTYNYTEGSMVFPD